MTLVPASRPQITREALADKVAPLGLDLAREPLAVVGVRGYFRDTMGAVGRNDRGIYDDALFLVSSNAFAAFNGNTDPSRVKRGSGHGAGKGMAVLKPGLYRGVYRIDIHAANKPSGHLALCQRAGPVTVIRDGNPPYPDTGMFGINIHRGGVNGTSSLGCQTIPPPQWPGFIGLLETEARRLFGAGWRTTSIPYALIEG